MLAIGRHHLDWGSADQPPVAPLLAALMDAIAPGSIVALRLPAVLATAAAVVVAALIARELGGDARAQALTAGAQATALWTTLAGHWLTPYTLEPVQWLLLGWLLVRWIRRRDGRLLLAAGVVAGIAAETKFQVLLLCAVLLLAAAACGPRELLRTPMLWAGVGIGALLALPTLGWQAANGWPQLRMGAVVTAEAEVLYGGRPGVAVTLVVLAGVAGTGLALYGLALLLRTAEYRFLAVTTLVLFAVFVAAPGRPYYLGGLYGLLAAAGAVGLQRRREAGRVRGRWVVWPAFLLSDRGRRRHAGALGDDRRPRGGRGHRAAHRGGVPRAAAGAAGPDRDHGPVLHPGRLPRRLLRAVPAARGLQRQPQLRLLPAAAGERRRRALRRLDARPAAAVLQRRAPGRRRRAGRDGLAVHRPPRAVGVALAAAADPDRRLSRPAVASDSRQFPSGARGRLDAVLLDEERCYRAVAARDARFDGHFITAVRTTGIYCRPSCPATTPQPGQRRVPAHRRRRPAARLPGLPALPARRGARLAGVEHPRRPGRPGHAPDRRRRWWSARACPAWPPRSATPSGT